MAFKGEMLSGNCPPSSSHLSATAEKTCSKKLPCENRGKANEEEAHDPGARGGERLGWLHRPQPADGGEGKVAGFDGSQQEHRASVFFSDGGKVELAGTDADRVLNAMEDFAGYHRS